MIPSDAEQPARDNMPAPPASYPPLAEAVQKAEGLSPLQILNQLVLRHEASEQIKKITALENSLEDLRDEKRRGERSLFLKLLPIMDSLDRMLRQVNSENELVSSLETLRSQFVGVLEEQDVVPIPLEIGQKLDITLCDISRQQPRADLEPDLIIQIDRRGYYFQSKVLRKARVVISITP